MADASGYSIQLYKGGTTEVHAIAAPVSVAADITEHNLSALLRSCGAGSYTFTVSALDAAGESGAASAHSAALSLYTVSLPVGEGLTAMAEGGSASPVVQGGSYRFSLTLASGYSKGPGFTVSANGQSLTADANGIYTLTGIGQNTVINVSDLVAGGTIANIPVITTQALPNGAMGQSYALTLALEKPEAVTWSCVGALPPGLSLHPGTGLLSGTPTRSGQWSFTIRAANAVGEAKMLYSLTVTGESYPLSLGNGSEWIRGSEDTLRFQGGSGSGEELREVLVDGVAVAAGDMDISGGVLTLRPAFLKTLTMGEHSIALLYSAGTAEGRFAVVQSDPSVAPSLLVQPLDVTVEAGEAANFSIRAEGTLPLVCQWQVDRGDGNGWVILPGAAAATLTLEEPSAEMDGWRYRCVVTNRSGTAESEAATLSVSGAQRAAAKGGAGALPWILGAAVLLAGGGCGGYYYIHKRGKAAGKEEQP